MSNNGSKWIAPRRRWAIYARDAFQCVYCLRFPPASELTLDHVRPQCASRRVALHRSDNLVTACLSCNCARNHAKVFGNRKWFAALRARGIDTRGLSKRIQRALRKYPVYLIGGVGVRPQTGGESRRIVDKELRVEVEVFRIEKTIAFTYTSDLRARPGLRKCSNLTARENVVR